MKDIIKIDHLSKSFGDVKAVHDLSFRVKEGELFALGFHISPYEQGNRFNTDPLREKKLLLHKQELRKLFGLLTREGYTLVPLSLYFSKGRVKMGLGLCKGKKLYDKRETIAKNEANREIERNVKAKQYRDE